MAISDFRRDGHAVFAGKRLVGIVTPFLGGFVERLVVPVQFVFQGELGFVRFQLGS